MTFTMTVHCDNAAFEDNLHPELANILDVTRVMIWQGKTEGKLYDTNGNKVGKYLLTSE